jgi:hypothetical protein
MNENLHTLCPAPISEELEKALDAAADLEQAEQHLSADERKALVDQYRQERPHEELPEDVNEAFVEIVF